MIRDSHTQKGRFLFILLRRSPRSSLLPFVIVILLTGLIYLPALLLSASCTKVPTQKEGCLQEEDPAEVELESSLARISFQPQKPAVVIDNVSVFAYESDGLGRLVAHKSLKAPGPSLDLECPRGETDLVAVANLRKTLDTAALERYDSMELVCIDFSQDDPTCPVMVGEFHFDLHKDTAIVVQLVPLMSEVVVRQVSNETGGYARLEDPVVWLTGRNARAELLRKDGFCPQESLPDTAKFFLPCDIGLQPQYPGTRLSCYPNDSSSPALGTSGTGIAFECGIGGERHLFRSGLPSIHRNSVIYASITIRGCSECIWEFDGC